MGSYPDGRGYHVEAKKPMFQAIAETLDAWKRCKESGNLDWLSKWEAYLDQLAGALPSGSGWDSGTKIDLARSTSESIVLLGSFHHMNDGGFYDGWTDHTIRVRASLTSRIRITVSGRNRNDIKEHLHEIFYHAMMADVPERKD